MPKGLKYAKYTERWKKLYEEEKMSFREIAKLDKVDAKTVNRTLQGHVTIRSKSKWNSYGEEWYNLHVNKKYTKARIAKEYGTHTSTVSNVLERIMGVAPKTNKSKRKYAHLVDDFSAMYKAGHSLRQIAIKHGVDTQTVLNYLNEQEDVEIRELSQALRKYELNEHYFDVIDSQVKAYHLGLLFATGTVLELHNSYATQVTIHEEKDAIIKPLIEVLRGKDVGCYMWQDNIKRYRFHSKHMYEVLKGHGLTSKINKCLPKLNDGLYAAFIAGYAVEKSHMTKTNNHLCFTGSKAFLEALKDLLVKEIDAEEIYVYKVDTNEYRLMIHIEEIIDSVYEWMDVF